MAARAQGEGKARGMLGPFAMIVGVAGAALAWAARNRQRRLAPIAEAVEGRSIAGLGSGRYRVAGRVEPTATSPSAVDGMACVYIERAEYRQVGSSLVPLLREVERCFVSHPFWLDDGTGRLLVDPSRAAVEAATLAGDDGLTAERRLRAGEEIEMVATFRPAEVEGDGGPYRAPALVWEATDDELGPPRITHRTERGMMTHTDDVTSFLRGTGTVLLAIGALLGILALF